MSVSRRLGVGCSCVLKCGDEPWTLGYLAVGIGGRKAA